MCGISGYFGSGEISQERIETCLRLMRRRGPDHQGYKHLVSPAGENVYLLSSRLAIIDLDPRANQPFHIGGNSWFVFNGELYNYRELRKSFERANFNYLFRTESDTEVGGVACNIALDHAISFDDDPMDDPLSAMLNDMEGMWTFALYHEDSGSLFLSRDRFGEKPLYLYRDNTGLYFGSEPKFIFALLGKKLPINYGHLYRYLVNGYKSLYKQETTFFKRLEEIPPGHVLRIDAQGEHTFCWYWDPKFEPNEDLTYGEAVKGVKERLIRSVELRLRADVPLAFCHSGGIDSNSLIAIAKRHYGYDVHSFHIANTDKRYEEVDLVDLAVKELGIRHTRVPLTTAHFLENLRELIRYHDSPVSTITWYTHWILMQAVAEQGYKVSISGTGADEMFSGYYDHHLWYLAELAREGRGQERWDAEMAWHAKILPFVRNPFLCNPLLFQMQPHFRDYIYSTSDSLEKYLYRGKWSVSDPPPDFGALPLEWDEIHPFIEEEYTEDVLRNRMMNEMFQESVPVILHEDDLNAMYWSIENRSPFLDRSLYEYSLTIPTTHLIQKGLAKAILRDAVRGLVPERILNNPRKVGWNAPIRDLLDVNQSEVRAWLLDQSPIYEHVQKEHIEGLVKKSYWNEAESKFLWAFVNCKIFLEE